MIRTLNLESVLLIKRMQGITVVDHQCVPCVRVAENQRRHRISTFTQTSTANMSHVVSYTRRRSGIPSMMSTLANVLMFKNWRPDTAVRILPTARAQNQSQARRVRGVSTMDTNRRLIINNQKDTKESHTSTDTINICVTEAITTEERRIIIANPSHGGGRV